MVANDDFDGKAPHINCFYMHMIFEQKYLKPYSAIRGLQNGFDRKVGSEVCRL